MTCTPMTRTLRVTATAVLGIAVGAAAAGAAPDGGGTLRGFFPFGIWYQGCLTDKGIYQATMAEDVVALGLNFAIANADTRLAPDAPDPTSLASMLALADRVGLKVLVGLAPLVKNEISQAITTTEEFARRRDELKAKLAPFVAAGAKHASVLAWWCGDEPVCGGVEKVKVAEQLRLLFAELDPEHPAFCEGPWSVIERDALPHLQHLNEPVYMPEVYPFWNRPFRVGVGDFRSSGFRSPGEGEPAEAGWVQRDIIEQYRLVRPHLGERRLWPWLAAFRETAYEAPGWDWRAPLPAELRCQAWIALAEGCTGLCWFGYEHARAFGDHATLFPEIKAVVAAVSPLTDVLLDGTVSDSLATVRGGGGRYYESALVETLRDSHGTAYLIVVNRNCEETGNSRVTVEATLPAAQAGTRWLAIDPATNAIVAAAGGPGLALELDLRPGDGRLLRLIAAPETKPSISPDIRTVKIGEELRFEAAGGVHATAPFFYRWSLTGFPAGQLDPFTGRFTATAPGRFTVWCRDAAGNAAFTRDVRVVE